jgi:cytochrome c
MGANLPAEMESDMFDTMTLTKTVGALCGSLLVFMLGGWVAEIIFSDGHGDGHEAMFVVFVEGEGEEAAPAEEEVNFEELFAAADAAAGEDVFKACSSCHSVEQGDNRTGPYLYGVVGRPVDGAEGYGDYSGALVEANAAGVWTAEELFHFLADPKGYAPGTGMTYNGLRRETDRVNLIAWLDSLDN